MKKILSIAIAILICVSVTGCRRNRANNDESKRFVTVSEEQICDSELTIVSDKETSVCYLIYKSGHKGGITPLIGKDGKPVLYNNR
jgi:lipoprotein